MYYKDKRTGIYQVDLQIGGRRVRRSAQTSDEKLARRYHAQVEADLWQQAKLGDKPAYRWGDAVMEFLEVKKAKRSLSMDKAKLDWITQRWTAGKPLTEITADAIEALLRRREAEQIQVGKGMTLKRPEPATINRYAAVISGVLNVARDRGWIDAVPRIRKRAEAQAPETFLTREQCDAIWRELPEHLKPVVRFALATGLRKANVIGLTWDRVNLEARHAWVQSTASKNRKAISVPLSDDAIAALRECEGKHPVHVFTYKGNPIREPAGRALKLAYERAGLGHLKRRFHLLRHTFASQHVMAGTPQEVLQRLGGWSTPAMLQRYAHLSPGFVAAHVNNIASSNPRCGTTQLDVTAAST